MKLHEKAIAYRTVEGCIGERLRLVSVVFVRSEDEAVHRKHIITSGVVIGALETFLTLLRSSLTDEYREWSGLIFAEEEGDIAELTRLSDELNSHDLFVASDGFFIFGVARVCKPRRCVFSSPSFLPTLSFEGFIS